jgi:hypothetical protein
MSAYIVNPDHLRLLVSAAVRWRLAYYAAKPYSDQSNFRRITNDDGDRLMRMLYEANRHSVDHRYPGEDRLPGADLATDDVNGWAPEFRFVGEDIHDDSYALQVLKAIRCYTYQSCEDMEAWEDSEAERFCDALTIAGLSELPGYEDAAWEYQARRAA